MKIIRLYHEKSDVIELQEDVDQDKDTIAEHLSNLFSNTNISILSTKNSTAVVRPSKLNAIVIEEIDINLDEDFDRKFQDVMDEQEEEEGKPQESEPEKTKEPEEDIITDVDVE